MFQETFFPGTRHFLAEACGNRTHPGRLSATRNGFEARENHQAPCASGIDLQGSSKIINHGSDEETLLKLFHSTQKSHAGNIDALP